jgi:hypothetical protein
VAERINRFTADALRLAIRSAAALGYPGLPLSAIGGFVMGDPLSAIHGLSAFGGRELLPRRSPIARG